MLDRMAVGSLPDKHHVRHEVDGALVYEHCLTRGGFDGAYTILYHRHRPQTHLPVACQHGSPAPVAAGELPLRKRHLVTGKLAPRTGPLVDVRVPLAFNADVVLSMACPTEPDPVYLVNGDADDLFYVFEGTGTVRTQLGDLRYEPGDYVCVPRGIAHRLVPDEASAPGGATRLFVIELTAGLGLLSQFRNETGQLKMDAPYCHRDFKRPLFRGALDEGIRTVVSKRRGKHHAFELAHGPLDVLGWDGAVYPWVFPISRFQPRVGQVHLPPTYHGTFAARGALVCSFVPRMTDFHPSAIPCPYPHSSVHCDEVLFYVKGNFTSRKGVGPGSLSYHPMGLPHGPHPGSYEASIGSRSTDELAVMLDTFAPLELTPFALEVDDPSYMQSFR
jgi:homogentisate 1,2-dioxygenase